MTNIETKEIKRTRAELASARSYLATATKAVERARSTNSVAYYGHLSAMRAQQVADLAQRLEELGATRTA